MLVMRKVVPLAVASALGVSLIGATSPPPHPRSNMQPDQPDARQTNPTPTIDRFRFDQMDTLWFGGRDPVTGVAVAGGVWDFDDSTSQGWSSVDLTDMPPRFRHVTHDSALAHGDPLDPTITFSGSQGSIWCGAHQDEATTMGWVGGQGYGNHWRQSFIKSFPGATGLESIAYDYFVDSEECFDFVFVYAIAADGSRVGPLNPADGNCLSSYGHSGSWASPSAPRHVSYSLLGLAFDTIEITFVSDYIVSDADGWGALSDWGAFGVDNILVDFLDPGTDDLSDFEPGGDPLDGWMPVSAPPAGRWMHVARLDDLDPPTGGTCSLSSWVLLASDTDGSGSPHPADQDELLVSNAIDVSQIPEPLVAVLEFDRFEDMDFVRDGVLYACWLQWYPYTSPHTGQEMGWGPQWDWVGGGSHSGVGCGRWFQDSFDPSPPESGVDSLRVALWISQSCPMLKFYDLCDEYPPQSNQSPYWDNIRVGIVVPAVTPVPGPDTQAPDTYRLHATHPNPFALRTSIDYELPAPARVTLQILDVGGRAVRTLIDQPESAGRRAVSWDGRDQRGARVPSGVYFCRLRVDGHVETRQMILTR